MNSQVRVRYAPSPTGMQHIGGIRTALFNYFFARSRGGSFVLRVEDTDRTRFDPRALDDIYASFAWLGIAPDESPAAGGDYGPYVQSDRLDLYRTWAERLVEAGRAYWDYTTAPRDASPPDGGSDASDNALDETPEESPRPYNYEGRTLPPEAIEAAKAAGVVPVLRLLVPAEGETVFEDLVLGRIRRKHKDLQPDPILLKSDGFPTYHLANVIDDHLMEITHVLRAQEWVPSTPLHLLIYRAFGWEPPQFAHLPMVMGKDGGKLSKRHGSTSLVEFQREGYLPEAIVNYITMLGWSYDDSREFFSSDDLAELFTVERINKASAVFDYRKLDWYNGQYIRLCDEERLLDLLLPYVTGAGWGGDDGRGRLRALLPLVRERLRVLSDVVPLLRFVYEGVSDWPLDELLPKNASATDTIAWLDRAVAVVEAHGLPATDDEAAEAALDDAFRAAAEEAGTKLGNLMMPLRVAITGSRVSPPLIPSMRELGIDECRRRIAGARATLERASADGGAARATIQTPTAESSTKGERTS